MTLDKIHDTQFDLKYEELMKSKGMQIPHEMKKHSLADLQVRSFKDNNDIIIAVPPRQSEIDMYQGRNQGKQNPGKINSRPPRPRPTAPEALQDV